MTLIDYMNNNIHVIIFYFFYVYIVKIKHIEMRVSTSELLKLFI